MRFICLFLLLLLSASAMASEKAPAQGVPAANQKDQAASLDDLIANAKNLLDEQDAAAAKPYIDAALGRDPKNAPALNQLARYYLIDGFIGVTSTSNGTGSLFPVGVYKPDALQDAKETLIKAIEADPKYADAYALLAHVYVQNRGLRTVGLKIARDNLTMAQKYAPDNPWIHYYWAELLVHEGNWDEAASHCWRILQADKDDPNLLMNAVYFLTDYYTTKKDYEKADALFKQILAVSPSNYFIMTQYSIFLRVDMGDFDKAIDYADKSLRIHSTRDGNNAMAMALYAKWADISINHNDPIEAQKYFDIANRTISDLDYVMTYEGCYAAEKALVVALKARGISIDAPASSDGSTALMIAANNGRADAVKMLLGLGANPNATSRTGWTALMGAADEGHADVVDILLDAGADKDKSTNGTNAAMLASIRGRGELAEKIQNYKPHAKPKDDPSQPSA